MSHSPSSRTCRRRPFATSAFCALTVSLAASVPAVAVADEVRDEILRRDLAVIQEQLQQIEVVVERLEARQAHTNPESHRYYLDTDQMRRDLDSIAAGIDGYLEPPRLPPRAPIPLAGDYLRGDR